MNNTYNAQAPNKSVENTDNRYNGNIGNATSQRVSDCIPNSLPVPSALQNLDKINEELMQIVGVLRSRLDSVIQNLPCDPKKDNSPKESSYSIASQINGIANKTYSQVLELREIVERLAL